MAENKNLVLEVNDLRTYFYLDEGVLKAVDGISLEIEKEKVLGVVAKAAAAKPPSAGS